MDIYLQKYHRFSIIELIWIMISFIVFMIAPQNEYYALVVVVFILGLLYFDKHTYVLKRK